MIAEKTLVLRLSKFKKREVFMKELEYMKKEANPVSKAPQKVSHPPKTEQLRTMTTEELVKLLMSPELAQPVNAALRQYVLSNNNKHVYLSKNLSPSRSWSVLSRN
jgi:hypothetical protein